MREKPDKLGRQWEMKEIKTEAAEKNTANPRSKRVISGNKGTPRGKAMKAY